MANIVAFISLSFVFFIISAARPVPFRSNLEAAAQNHTHVCKKERFASLGLDVTEFKYCDSSLPYEVRARDLVSRMTLTEKVQQMGNDALGVPRIGLPKYQWWSEALHGVAKSGPGSFFDEVVPGATSFPTVILTTSSFNQSLWLKIGQVISTEARAMHNLGRAGLTFWSPNINVARDPRWGRILETPGEDPYVVGRYAVNFVRGMQDVECVDESTTGLGSRPLKVSACCKHFAAYDMDSWLGVDRWHFDAKVTEQDMAETFVRPFEMCVKDGGASSVMCSFNRINGIPACADPNLMKNKIRGEWNLQGYIVSDCDSIEVMVNDHKWLGDTGEDAAAQVLKAGLDLDCGVYYNKSLENAVRQGKVKEADIDQSLYYLYRVLMRLGFFDGNPHYGSLGKKDICSEENLELATEAAREGIVLLKNDDDNLPFSSSEFKSLALIGPHANATRAMIGNYVGIPCRYTSPLDGFSAFGKVSYAKGCGDIPCTNDTLISEAVETAKGADATILFVGLDLSFEREGYDREDLLLPGNQTNLINQVTEASKGPVVLVIMSAGGIDISFAKANPKIKSILWVGYPGEEGGRAIADVVFGNYNPGGRLPLTWYKADYADRLPMTSMQLRPDESKGYPGRTYRFFNETTVYPFGFGLSYTKFQYKMASTKMPMEFKLNRLQHCRSLDIEQPADDQSCPSVLVDDLSCNTQITFDVIVENVGEKDGTEVVMVYSKPPEGIVGTPYKQVIGFEKVFVPAKGSQKVSFTLDACKSLNIVDSSAYKVLPSGVHTIMVGGDAGTSFPVEVSFVH